MVELCFNHQGKGYIRTELNIRIPDVNIWFTLWDNFIAPELKPVKI